MSQRLAAAFFVAFSILTTPLLAADAAAPRPAGQQPPLVIHATDLFRPHGDPDDHWDLATLYALAAQNRVDLRAVLIDYPPPRRGKADPDVAAVAQMNYLTGKAVPAVVGCPREMKKRTDTLPDASPREMAGVELLIQMLREAPRPVVLHVVGTCNDVALAGRRAPEVFTRKCAAVYLNAGSGTPDAQQARKLEYNVALNPAAYAAMFDLPCPVYWMPCFEITGQMSGPAEWGTFYRFRQSEILPQLSPPLQGFFAAMYRDGEKTAREQGPRTNWLQALIGPPDAAVIERESQRFRNMWCTAGFLHCAGLTVTIDGRIVSLSEGASDAVFEFRPIRVTCADDGVTTWQPDAAAKQRWIFRVRDMQRYTAAMTAALRALLVEL